MSFPVDDAQLAHAIEISLSEVQEKEERLKQDENVFQIRHQLRSVPFPKAKRTELLDLAKRHLETRTVSTSEMNNGNHEGNNPGSEMEIDDHEENINSDKELSNSNLRPDENEKSLRCKFSNCVMSSDPTARCNGYCRKCTLPFHNVCANTLSAKPSDSETDHSWCGC
jgi:hypothetical protein